jgi:hypothetical protein
MESYIKYKRVHASILDSGNNIQDFFDDLSANGWDIIDYHEKIISNENNKNGDESYAFYIDITAVLGKKQSNML